MTLEIIPERPHHAVLTMKLADGYIDEYSFCEAQRINDYPSEVTTSFLEASKKFRQKLALIIITQPGIPDFHCRVCLEKTNNIPPCYSPNKISGYNPDRDVFELNRYHLCVDQFISFDNLKLISEKFGRF